jgi:hypothetical protein
MVAGNIQNFPEMKTRSQRMECQEASLSNDSDSLSITGQIVVKDEDSTSPAIKTEFTIQFSAKDASRLGFKA